MQKMQNMFANWWLDFARVWGLIWLVRKGTTASIATKSAVQISSNVEFTCTSKDSPIWNRIVGPNAGDVKGLAFGDMKLPRLKNQR